MLDPLSPVFLSFKAPPTAGMEEKTHPRRAQAHARNSQTTSGGRVQLAAIPVPAAPAVHAAAVLAFSVLPVPQGT